MTVRPWRFLAICGVLAVVHFVLPAAALQNAVYAVVSVAGMVAVVVGARRHRPPGVVGWYLMAAGLALWLLHDGVYTALESLQVQPFITGVNLVALAGYPLLFI